MIIAPRTATNILASNIVAIEVGVNVYDPLSAYVTYDVVQINGTTNRKYKAVQAVPAGTDPLVDVNPVTGRGTYWWDAGATNYAKAFDELGSSKCENADSIYYEFSISDIDVLMLGNLNSATVRLKIVDLDTTLTVLDATYSTLEREVYDWQEWTIAVPEYHSSFYKILPITYNATLEVWIDNPTQTASVGHIAYGRSKNYGLSLIDPKPISSRRGITSKTRSADGNITTRRKARYRRMKITCLIDSKSIDIIEDRLEAIVDTPCIFVGDERDGGYKALLIYGEMKDHDMPISVTKTTYLLEVEGYQ